MDKTPIPTAIGNWTIERGPRPDTWLAKRGWICVEVEPGEIVGTYHVHFTESGCAEARFESAVWLALFIVGSTLLSRVKHAHEG